MNRPAGDLSLLLSAVSDPRRPAPELLVRYVDEPGSLSDAERAEVEEAVEADPLLAAELHTLQSFRFPAPLELPARRERLRSGFRGLWMVGSLAASATAAALLALLCRNEAMLEPSLSVGTQGLGSSAPLAFGRPALEPTIVPSPLPGPSTAPLIAAAPPEPLEPGPQPPPAKPRPVDRPSLAPADVVVAPVAPPEPIALAFVEPEYRPPAAAAARYRSGGGTRAAGVAGGRLDLEALAPTHVALTRSPAPSLFWSLAALPAGSISFELTLSAAMTPEPVLERALPAPAHPGLQRIQLSSYGVELEPGIEYTWTVSADVGGNLSMAQGWIQRTEAPAQDPFLAPGERPARYAAAGLWYDAVEALADLAEQYPEVPGVGASLQALAERARLESN